MKAFPNDDAYLGKYSGMCRQRNIEQLTLSHFRQLRRGKGRHTLSVEIPVVCQQCFGGRIAILKDKR